MNVWHPLVKIEARVWIWPDPTRAHVHKDGKAKTAQKVCHIRVSIEMLMIMIFFTQELLQITFCFSDIDECFASPCVHGLCSNLPGDFQCICEKGWSGRYCDQGKAIIHRQKKIKQFKIIVWTYNLKKMNETNYNTCSLIFSCRRGWVFE